MRSVAMLFWCFAVVLFRMFVLGHARLQLQEIQPEDGA